MVYPLEADSGKGYEPGNIKGFQECRKTAAADLRECIWCIIENASAIVASSILILNLFIIKSIKING